MHSVFSNITIYPVPEHGTVTISFSDEQVEKKCDIRIRSLEGKLLHDSGTIRTEETYSIQLDSFPRGIYVLSIEIDKKTMFYKLVVN